VRLLQLKDWTGKTQQLKQVEFGRMTQLMVPIWYKRQFAIKGHAAKTSQIGTHRMAEFT
jgi:hypothetical protein